MRLISSTVPLFAVVVNHTKEFAGIVASLNEVTTLPVVVEVVVVPLVTTSFPVALLSVECRTLQVTEGVALPRSTQAIFVMVIATSVKNIVSFSVEVGDCTEILLLQSIARFVLAPHAVLEPVPQSAIATSVLHGA